jgi:hypothetical protein
MVDGNWYESRARNEERRRYEERSRKQHTLFHSKKLLRGFYPYAVSPAVESYTNHSAGEQQSARHIVIPFLLTARAFTQGCSIRFKNNFIWLYKNMQALAAPHRKCNPDTPAPHFENVRANQGGLSATTAIGVNMGLTMKEKKRLQSKECSR